MSKLLTGCVCFILMKEVVLECNWVTDKGCVWSCDLNVLLLGQEKISTLTCWWFYFFDEREKETCYLTLLRNNEIQDAFKIDMTVTHS